MSQGAAAAGTGTGIAVGKPVSGSLAAPPPPPAGADADADAGAGADADAAVRVGVGVGASAVAGAASDDSADRGVRAAAAPKPIKDQQAADDAQNAAAAGDGDKSKAKSYWKYWQFPAGLGFLVLGSVFAVFVFGLAGQSELAPMGAVTMIFNTILAWRFLGEPFTRIDFIATFLMGSGTIIAVAFGESSDEEYTLDELIDLLDRPVVWWVFGGEMVAIISLLVFVHTIGSQPVRMLKPWQRRLDAFGRPFIGGALSGFTGFLTKSSVEVAFSSVENGDGDDWGRWEVYVFLVCLGFCIFFQLKYMNSGLGRVRAGGVVAVSVAVSVAACAWEVLTPSVTCPRQYDSMLIIPIYQSVLVIAAAVSGLIYFDELQAQNDTSITLFIIGCSITATGIGVLLLKSRSASDPDTVDRSVTGDEPEHTPHAGIVELSAIVGGNSMAAAESIAGGDDAAQEANAVYPRRRSSATAVDIPPPRVVQEAKPGAGPDADVMLSPSSERDNPLDHNAAAGAPASAAASHVLSPSNVAV